MADDGAAAGVLEAAGIPHVGVDDMREWPRAAAEPAFVAFVAPWCEVCRDAAGVLAGLPQTLSGRAALRYVDTDRFARDVERLGVRRVPALVLFARGREVARCVELATGEEYALFIDRALADVPPGDAAPVASGPASAGAGAGVAAVPKPEP